MKLGRLEMKMRWRRPAPRAQALGAGGVQANLLGSGVIGDRGNDAPSPVITAFSIIKLLSGVEGTLPRSIHERDDLARRPVRTPETEYLWGRPNSDWRTAPKAWWMTVFAYVEGWGNAYLWRRRVGSRTIGLEFIHPSRVTPVLNDAGEKVFEVYRAGSPTPSTHTADEILHVFGVSFDGVTGVKPVRAGLATHEHALLLDAWGREFLLNGGRYSGMVSTQEALDDEDYDEWADSWERQHSGPRNVGKTILMDRGAQYHQLSIPPEEAQYLESRQFTREEVLGIYAPGLPHHLVGWRSNTSNFGTGLEAQGRHLAAFVLLQRLELVADSIGLELLPPELELEFRLDRLMRADPKVMAEVYLKMRQGAAASREDWRSAVGLPPIEGLADDLTYQRNMQVVDLGGEVRFEESDSQESAPPDDEIPPNATLADVRCGNSACRSRAGGKPGRLLVRAAGEVEAMCPTCGTLTRVGRGRRVRDAADYGDAVMAALAPRGLRT